MSTRFPRALLLGLTTAACSLPAALAAQTTFGVTAGIVSAKVTESFPDAPTATEGSKTGFVGGITMSFALSKVIAFAPEILYVQKGYDQHNGRSGDIGPYEEIADFDYVEIPVLFKVRFGGHERRFFLLGGPSVSFKTSCSLKDLSGGRVDLVSCQFDQTTPFIGSTDIGGTFGAGMSYRRFTLSLRDDIGFSNVLSSKIQADQPGTSLKNRALSLAVGVTFGK